MAETNLIKKNDLAREREMEFVDQFGYSIKKLVEALGVTRKIPKQAGTVLKAYKATGTLESGIVGEGETIPLSHYKVEPVNYAEITLKKWRKATSAEAITDRGYDQAVEMTTTEMLRDVQRSIRKSFFDFLATGSGAVSGKDFQSVLAQAWGNLQVLFEDDEIGRGLLPQSAGCRRLSGEREHHASDRVRHDLRRELPRPRHGDSQFQRPEGQDLRHREGQHRPLLYPGQWC